MPKETFSAIEPGDVVRLHVASGYTIHTVRRVDFLKSFAWMWGGRGPHCGVPMSHLSLVRKSNSDDRFAVWLDTMRIRSADPSRRAHFDAWERLQNLASDQAELIAGQAEALDDVKRLTRELGVALNGEDGAAPQASLCDIVAQVKAMQLLQARAGEQARKREAILNEARDLGSPGQTPVATVREAKTDNASPVDACPDCNGTGTCFDLIKHTGNGKMATMPIMCPRCSCHLRDNGQPYLTQNGEFRNATDGHSPERPRNQDNKRPDGCFVDAGRAPSAAGDGDCQADGHHIRKRCANHEGMDA